MPTPSFFNFFSPPQAPVDEEDATSDIEERLELDYQLGEDIKEKLIPYAIDWFTGEALQFEGDDDEPAMFEDEDDEEDDDISEERDDDEEESDDEVGWPVAESVEARIAHVTRRTVNRSRNKRPLNANRARVVRSR